MDDLILYCDCDGVVYNTIDVAYQIMIEDGCNMQDRGQIDYYFKRKIDWDIVFRRAEVIDDAFDKIRQLKTGNYFKRIDILTSLSGGYTEEGKKRFNFREELPDSRVITVQYGIPKGLVVPNISRSILIDDEKRNCIKFENYGGTAILFTRDQVDLDNNIVNSILDIPNTSGYKKLIKTR